LKAIIEIGHPKDINIFGEVLSELQKRGHSVKIVARDKENIREILREYRTPCEFGPHYKTIFGKAFGVLINDLWLYKISRKYNPDVFISFGSPYSAHVSAALGKFYLAFIDTEIAGLANKLMLPFAEKVYTSSSFYDDLGPKQIRFNSYYELAYLHPSYFKPDPCILEKYGLIKDGYIIIRLSALKAHHDINARGFGFKNEEELKNYLSQLEKYGRVIVSSEINHWPTIENYKLNFHPKDLHHIMYFAKMYIGEGASMASEAAILGVPAIYVSNTHRGYLDELELYGLAFTIQDREEALKKAISLLKDNSLINSWKEKRERLINEKIDIVEFMVNEIEGAHKF